jgi:beta-glucosidase
VTGVIVDPPATLAALPADFRFGTATAAYQIEGGVDAGGRGPSIWDTFAHTPGRTHRGDTGDIACDHFHRWEADLDLMAELGLPAYRMSLSWSRLQPAGTGDLNPDGVRFYRGVLDGCRQRGITPLVTLYHWDLPQPLQDAGGWPARHTADRFADYAGRCVDAFADLVDDWITINEPWCVSFLSHEWGVQAPGVEDPNQAIRAAHHTLLAHGLALQQLRTKAPAARVGITNIVSNVNPGSDSPADVAAAAELDIRLNRIFLEPCYHGDYPDDVLAVFAPAGLAAGETDGDLVRPGDLDLIAAPTDFVGINHYTNVLAHADAGRQGGIRIEQVAPTPTSFGWSNTPDALRDVLTRVSKEYSPAPIVVTENGASFNDYVDPSGEVRDVERIDYLRGYIGAVGEAVAAGVDVRGYFAWSLFDNFEWAEGYDKRFGLVYVDYRTQDRIPKASALWYRDLIATFHRLKRTPQ